MIPNFPHTRFELYPEEQAWWSFADYAAVLEVTRRLAPRAVLEFGPGSSTLALIEGGAGLVTACEDDEHWATIADQRIVARFPTRVELVRYIVADPIEIPGVDDRRFDLALIDGPLRPADRLPVLRYCLDRCAHVLIACENADGKGLRPAIARIARLRGNPVEYLETGPLAGSFALLGPVPPPAAA